MIRLVIDYDITSKDSLNRIYSGIHWAKRKQHADYWHYLARSAAQNTKAKPTDGPVEIEISYCSRLDIDNHGYLAKLIIDGLKGTIIKDDTKRYIRRLVQSFHDDKGKIYITITESKNT